MQPLMHLAIDGAPIFPSSILPHSSSVPRHTLVPQSKCQNQMLPRATLFALIEWNILNGPWNNKFQLSIHDNSIFFLLLPFCFIFSVHRGTDCLCAFAKHNVYLAPRRPRSGDANAEQTICSNEDERTHCAPIALDFERFSNSFGCPRFVTLLDMHIGQCVCFPLHPVMVVLGPFFIAKFRAREFVHPRTEILRTAPDEVMEDINFKLQPFPLGRPVELGLAR